MNAGPKRLWSKLLTGVQRGARQNATFSLNNVICARPITMAHRRRFSDDEPFSVRVPKVIERHLKPGLAIENTAAQDQCLKYCPSTACNGSQPACLSTPGN